MNNNPQIVQGSEQPPAGRSAIRDVYYYRKSSTWDENSTYRRAIKNTDISLLRDILQCMLHRFCMEIPPVYFFRPFFLYLSLADSAAIINTTEFFRFP